MDNPEDGFEWEKFVRDVNQNGHKSEHRVPQVSLWNWQSSIERMSDGGTVTKLTPGRGVMRVFALSFVELIVVALGHRTLVFALLPIAILTFCPRCTGVETRSVSTRIIVQRGIWGNSDVVTSCHGQGQWDQSRRLWDFSRTEHTFGVEVRRRVKVERPSGVLDGCPRIWGCGLLGRLARLL